MPSVRYWGWDSPPDRSTPARTRITASSAASAQGAHCRNCRVAAYDVHDGHFVGRLTGPDGKLLKIDGLWGMQFGNGILNQPTNVLFFAAGPDDENHGLYGSIRPVKGEEDESR